MQKFNVKLESGHQTANGFHTTSAADPDQLKISLKQRLVLGSGKVHISVHCAEVLNYNYRFAAI